MTRCARNARIQGRLGISKQPRQAKYNLNSIQFNCNLYGRAQYTNASFQGFAARKTTGLIVLQFRGVLELAGKKVEKTGISLQSLRRRVPYVQKQTHDNNVRIIEFDGFDFLVHKGVAIKGLR